MAKFDALLQRIIGLLFLGLFFFLPIIFWIPNSEVFELPKMYFVYAMTTLIVGLWLMRMVLAGRIIWRRTPLDIPILLFLLSQIASTIYSIDPHVSWFGWYGRFNGGLLSTISYTVLYYAMINNFFIRQSDKWINRQTDKQTKGWIDDPIIHSSNNLIIRLSDLPGILPSTILASAVIVSAYALLQHFGIDRYFWVQDVMNRVFSTQGQPNWLAAYIVALIFIPISNLLNFQFSIFPAKRDPAPRDNFQSIFNFSIFNLLFIALLFTKSRSGLLGFAVADTVFWLIAFAKKESRVKSKKSKRFLLVHTIIILLFLFTDNPVKKMFFTPYSLLPTSSPTKSELGGTESGDIRKLVWSGALKIAKQNPIFGTGPETFGLTYWQVRPKEANLTSEWNFLYNKAHNEWLNLAANTGLFGLGSHLLLICWFAIWSLRQIRETGNKKQGAMTNEQSSIIHYPLSIAVLSATVGVEVINFFGFSTVTTETYRYLFMGMAVAMGQKEAGIRKKEEGKKISLPTAYCLLFTVFLATIYLIIQISDLFRADLNYNRGRQFYSAGVVGEAINPLYRAVELAPDEPVFRNELAETQAVLAISLSTQDPSSLTPQDDIEPLKEAALVNFKIVSTKSKYNLTFVRTQAQMEFLMREIDPDLTGEALLLAQKAIDLSPTDPRGYYLLGRMYGELDDKSKAEKLYRQALELKPDYGEANVSLNSIK